MSYWFEKKKNVLNKWTKSKKMLNLYFGCTTFMNVT